MRFKFSKMLRGLETAPIRRYLQLMQDTQRQIADANDRLAKAHDELMAELAETHRISRALTPVCDPSHLEEHDVAFLYSKEMEEGDEPVDQDRTTVH